MQILRSKNHRGLVSRGRGVSNERASSHVNGGSSIRRGKEKEGGLFVISSVRC